MSATCVVMASSLSELHSCMLDLPIPSSQGLFADWNALHPDAQIQSLIFITDLVSSSMFPSLQHHMHRHQMPDCD
eukprot:3397970-Amphidinium_carterae.2